MTGSGMVSLRKAYQDSFLADVHELLALGYVDASPRIRADHEEEDITGLIAEAIQDKLDLLGGKFTRYAIKETSPVRSEGRLGKRRRELDIVVECSAWLPRVQFIFEAKRLRSPGHPIGEYLGKDGLLRFIRSEYASDSPAAGMVGYVQSHTPDRWYGELARKFGADTAGDLRLVQSLSAIRVEPSLTHEWTSEHERDDGTRIIIYHILLLCQ